MPLLWWLLSIIRFDYQKFALVYNYASFWCALPTQLTLFPCVIWFAFDLCWSLTWSVSFYYLSLFLIISTARCSWVVFLVVVFVQTYLCIIAPHSAVPSLNWPCFLITFTWGHTSYLSFFLHICNLWFNFSPHKSVKSRQNRFRKKQRKSRQNQFFNKTA